MLNGLDAIDWSAEAHALGSAQEIPAWLRALGGKQAKARDKALAALSNAINHQGWASPVATRVVPFLLELAAPTQPSRDGVLRLLADLSVGGNHESYSSLRLGLAEQPILLPEMSALRQAVLEGEELFLEALGDADSAVRGAAAVAAAFATQDEARAMAALEARLGEETDPGALASALCAMGYLARRAGPLLPLPKSVAPLQKHAHGWVRAAVGVASFYAELSVPTRCRTALLDAVKTATRSPSFAFHGGDMRGLAALVAVGDAAHRGDAANLRKLFQAAPAAERLPIAQRVMALLFDDVPTPRLADDLTEPQRAWLEALSRTNVHPWTQAAHWYGIPTRQGLSRYLHGSERPLDRSLDDVPLWKHCFDALHGSTTDEAWQQRLRSELGEDEVIALCADAYAFDGYLLYPWPPENARTNAAAHVAHTLSFWGRTLAGCCSTKNLADRLDELLAQLPKVRRSSETLACLLGMLESGEEIDARYDPLLKSAGSVVAPSVWQRVLRALPETRREPLSSGLHPGNHGSIDRD
jgi:hypothetical protein